MHRYQQKGVRLQEFSLEFCELIQAGSNCELKDIIDHLQVYMYVHKLFDPAISAKTVRHLHPALQKAIDYAQKIESEFLLVEGIQLTYFDTVKSIDASAGNDPMKL